MSDREKKIFTLTQSLAWQTGPSTIELPCSATIRLPSGYRYLDIPQSKKLLAAYGHTHNESTQGIVGSADPGAEWQIYLDYDESGYVKDDEKLDAEDVMKAMREGQDEINKERKAAGHPAVHIGEWLEAPRYDGIKHHLVWGIRARAEGEESDAVNYNTRILGRRGFISLNLVTSADDIERYKPEATTILGITEFNAGSRYVDFSEKTDKVAEYGLAGLILGGAGLGVAKLAGKAGLIALLAKGGKGFLVLLLAPLAALKRWLSRKKNPTP